MKVSETAAWHYERQLKVKESEDCKVSEIAVLHCERQLK